MIPDAAVTAATRVLYADKMSNHSGDNSRQIIDACEVMVKKILEAAAPHMLNPPPPISEGPSEGADAVTGFPRAAYRKRRMG